MSIDPTTLDLPYPGLRAFRRDETHLFFGREGSIDEMVDRLAATHFLAVLGASGSGKSSLVRTGLLDALELGYLADAGSRWRIATFTPGGKPLENLARALLATRGTAPSEEAVGLMRGLLARGPRSIIEWAEEGNLPRNANLLILADQFEELFRFQDYAGREEAEAFVALLLESARSRAVPIYVTLTMRSEYLGACSLIEGLAEQINAGQYLTPRMTREQCRQAIEGPAGVCGFAIEPSLVNTLLNDLAQLAPWEDASANAGLDRLVRRADQLPLMQHVLNRLWTRAVIAEGREDVTLKLADYRALGGISSALSQHADEILDAIGPEAPPIAEAVFRRLTEGTSVADAVRRPTRFSELVAVGGGNRAAVTAVVDAFRSPGCNFLQPGLDVPLADDTVIDISHESLIRQWQRLSTWLAEEARSADFWRRLVSHANLHAAREGGLLSGLSLANFLRWWDEEKPTAEWAARYRGDYGRTVAFLDASRIEEEKEREREAEAQRQALEDQRRRAEEAERFNRKLRRYVAVAVAVSVVAVAALGISVFYYYSAQSSAQLALEAQQKADKEADNARAAAERAQAGEQRLAGITDETRSIASELVRATVIGEIDQAQADDRWDEAGDLIGSIERYRYEVERNGGAFPTALIEDVRRARTIQQMQRPEISSFDPSGLAGGPVTFVPSKTGDRFVLAIRTPDAPASSSVLVFDALTGRLVDRHVLPEGNTVRSTDARGESETSLYAFASGTGVVALAREGGGLLVAAKPGDPLIPVTIDPEAAEADRLVPMRYAFDDASGRLAVLMSHPAGDGAPQLVLFEAGGVAASLALKPVLATVDSEIKADQIRLVGFAGREVLLALEPGGITLVLAIDPTDPQPVPTVIAADVSDVAAADDGRLVATTNADRDRPTQFVASDPGTGQRVELRLDTADLSLVGLLRKPGEGRRYQALLLKSRYGLFSAVDIDLGASRAAPAEIDTALWRGRPLPDAGELFYEPDNSLWTEVVDGKVLVKPYSRVLSDWSVPRSSDKAAIALWSDENGVLVGYAGKSSDMRLRMMEVRSVDTEGATLARDPALSGYRPDAACDGFEYAADPVAGCGLTGTAFRAGGDGLLLLRADGRMQLIGSEGTPQTGWIMPRFASPAGPSGPRRPYMIHPAPPPADAAVPVYRGVAPISGGRFVVLVDHGDASRLWLVEPLGTGPSAELVYRTLDVPPAQAILASDPSHDRVVLRVLTKDGPYPDRNDTTLLASADVAVIDIAKDRFTVPEPRGTRNDARAVQIPEGRPQSNLRAEFPVLSLAGVSAATFLERGDAGQLALADEKGEVTIYDLADTRKPLASFRSLLGNAGILAAKGDRLLVVEKEADNQTAVLFDLNDTRVPIRTVRFPFKAVTATILSDDRVVGVSWYSDVVGVMELRRFSGDRPVVEAMRGGRSGSVTASVLGSFFRLVQAAQISGPATDDRPAITAEVACLAALDEAFDRVEGRLFGGTEPIGRSEIVETVGSACGPGATPPEAVSAWLQAGGRMGGATADDEDRLYAGAAAGDPWALRLVGIEIALMNDIADPTMAKRLIEGGVVSARLAVTDDALLAVQRLERHDLAFDRPGDMTSAEPDVHMAIAEKLARNTFDRTALTGALVHYAAAENLLEAASMQTGEAQRQPLADAAAQAALARKAIAAVLSPDELIDAAAQIDAWTPAAPAPVAIPPAKALDGQMRLANRIAALTEIGTRAGDPNLLATLAVPFRIAFAERVRDSDADMARSAYLAAGQELVEQIRKTDPAQDAPVGTIADSLVSVLQGLAATGGRAEALELAQATLRAIDHHAPFMEPVQLPRIARLLDAATAQLADAEPATVAKLSGELTMAFVDYRWATLPHIPDEAQAPIIQLLRASGRLIDLVAAQAPDRNIWLERRAENRFWLAAKVDYSNDAGRYIEARDLLVEATADFIAIPEAERTPAVNFLLPEAYRWHAAEIINSIPENAATDVFNQMHDEARRVRQLSVVEYEKAIAGPTLAALPPVDQGDLLEGYSYLLGNIADRANSLMFGLDPTSDAAWSWFFEGTAAGIRRSDIAKLAQARGDYDRNYPTDPFASMLEFAKWYSLAQLDGAYRLAVEYSGPTDACDDAAAFANDPARRVQGLLFASLPDNAETVCQEAASREPGEARFRYQLARAQSRSTDRWLEYVPLLLETAREGYAASFNNLAYSLNDTNDPLNGRFSDDSPLRVRLSDRLAAGYGDRVVLSSFERLWPEMSRQSAPGAETVRQFLATEAARLGVPLAHEVLAKSAVDPETAARHLLIAARLRRERGETGLAQDAEAQLATISLTAEQRRAAEADAAAFVSDQPAPLDPDTEVAIRSRVTPATN